MFISQAKKFHQNADKTVSVYEYYRLMKAFRTPEGKPRKCAVLCLGTLDGFDRQERDELADILTSMIEKGQCVLCGNARLYDTALGFYAKYRESKYARENDPVLKKERERKERERLRDTVTVSLSSLTQHEARSIGCENLCNSTLRLLRIREYLNRRGWSREQVALALMQIIARAVYPYSELKTVRYLKENTALSDMFKVAGGKITKDALYQSALRLWEERRGLEEWLHGNVCSMFGIEERILLFDITNTYFEGRMANSEICRYGRSKEKRSDCKIVVLAAVVNTNGLLVRTMIYEGNRQDVTTLEEVVGSLSGPAPQETGRIVVMDAGFYSKENVGWLKENGYDYITVLPSSGKKFTPTSTNIINREDCKGQRIRLQAGRVSIDGKAEKALLVDSDAKALKERSIHDAACRRYEEGLEAIRAGLARKGGTKRRDAVNRRLGKLDRQYGAVRRNFTVTLTYEGKGIDEKAVGIDWTADVEKSGEIRKFHGKYVLLTSLDGTSESDIWKFYNVIRTVEETFHVLKSDLDIRPVFHKTDNGVKAHLNLAVLAYWIVSVTKYRLKLKKYPNVRWDEIMRIASTQVLVTAKVTTDKGDVVSIRQCTEAEDKLSEIYSLLDINHHPLGRVKSVGHPKHPPEKFGP